MIKKFISFLLLIVISRGFSQTVEHSENFLHEWNSTLTSAMVVDGFSPKLASRTYTYPFIAAYEVLINGDKNYKSFQNQFNALKDLPKADTSLKYNWEVAAIQATAIVGKKLVYREDVCDSLLLEQLNKLKPKVDAAVFKNSVEYGKQMALAILKWAKADSYAQTKALPAYIYTKAPGAWKPTPPEFRPACEANWGTLRPFVIKSVDDYRNPVPVKYSTDSASEFYKLAKQVYDIDKNRTPEQTTIAKFWDDNPDLITFTGHDMVPRRQMSPAAHWMGIAMIICLNEKAPILQTAETYSLVAVALADGFIASFKEKYSSNFIRPVTFIQENMDQDWISLLVTPPFPEHPSGHSCISASAATVLTKLYGANYKFTDSSERDFGYEPRTFNSFMDAANESSISRVYGGIHFMTGVTGGAVQGTAIGKYIVENIYTR